MKIEYETNLNRACMHIFLEKSYEEDYQLPMLRNNRMKGILAADGCEIGGKSRYTYEIGGYVSMQKKYEKTGMKKEELKNFVAELLETIDEVQEYMLEPGNLVLKPECIFWKEEKWWFCYLPDNPEELNQEFHKLTEYFVKTVDYKDTEAIFLAYELHRASFMEHFDLRHTLSEYEKQEKERKEELEELRNKKKMNENIFQLEDDEIQNKKKPQNPEFAYNPVPATTAIREDIPIWQPWKRRKKNAGKGRWGLWDDLIIESDN